LRIASEYMHTRRLAASAVTSGGSTDNCGRLSRTL